MASECCPDTPTSVQKHAEACQLLVAAWCSPASFEKAHMMPWPNRPCTCCPACRVYVLVLQASWVKMGPERAAALMSVGCSDMGGSIMNESITKAAGASHGQVIALGA